MTGYLIQPFQNPPTPLSKEGRGGICPFLIKTVFWHIVPRVKRWSRHERGEYGFPQIHLLCDEQDNGSDPISPGRYLENSGKGPSPPQVFPVKGTESRDPLRSRGFAAKEWRCGPLLLPSIPSSPLFLLPPWFLVLPKALGLKAHWRGFF